MDLFDDSEGHSLENCKRMCNPDYNFRLATPASPGGQDKNLINFTSVMRQREGRGAVLD